MVVDRDRKLLLRFVLSDYILIEKPLDLGWLRKMYVSGRRLIVLVFIDNVLANPDTFIANENRGTGDQFTNVILTFITERTSQDVVTVLLQCSSSPIPTQWAETHV